MTVFYTGAYTMACTQLCLQYPRSSLIQPTGQLRRIRSLNIQHPLPVLLVLLDPRRRRLGCETPDLPILLLAIHNSCLHNQVLNNSLHLAIVLDLHILRRRTDDLGLLCVSRRPLRRALVDRDGRAGGRGRQLLLALETYDALAVRGIRVVASEWCATVRDNLSGLELAKLPGHLDGAA